ncbi:retrovirus-related Pol polyprotein from transposon TNT 1-94 [Trichonephila clavipes]|uniref:Retrovirus-related Pol polyprotein from transposon TNT 1-94 n=1 Tax=Trichonephila clavipes TaxID=2585209 RepID=A0A8X6SP11_TRICX|nr:retrovirus-related Pol polyprotein from transposon TNT 1-94 [Trichonephila clavipes]
MDLCGPMPTESQGGNKYFLSIIDDYSRKVTVFPIRNKSDVFQTFIRFQKRAERFLSKKVIAVRTDGGLEFCNKDMDNFLTELGIKHEVTNSYTPEMNGVAERFNLTALNGIKTLLKSSEVPHKFWGEALLCFTYAWNRICHKDSNKTPFEKYSGRKPSLGIASKTFWIVKDSLTSRLVSKTSTETPSTSEKPDVSSDNHSLIACTEVKWIRNIGRKVTGSNVYYSIEGEATRLKSFNEIERYCKRHNIEYDPSLFNFRKDNTESQGFSDLSEQQEALMVEVTIPNCYKQAIRSRDASKWHDAMHKEINVMMERKVWDLVDHPDNIKILENRWVYTIKYDENNKIVRYKARLVARVSKTSTETPSTSEKPDVSSDNHSLIACTEVKWIRNIGRKVTGSNVYYSIEGEAIRLKSFNEIERYCKRHNIEYDPSLFNFRKDNTESQGFSDLSEQQEALMVEVTIPNCYKQAIRSRDASKWHDAMHKEINVMMERKVWDLVDHPDNIKILENRWVYTIKYDENNKIVRYKARLVARDTVIYMKQPTGYEIDNNKVFSKTSTETPSTSEKPDVSSDNHSLIACTEVKWIRNIGRKVTGSNVYYSIEGEATRLKSFNEIERYCKRHNIEYDPSLFNFRKDNTESQGFSDLSEQQEALMVEVTIPNCYKQAIRSRDASKWHDAMHKEINVMMERKVWDLVDHPDNIKILENRWVYTIKYDENNKIVRYKARLVARDTVIYMKQPTGYEIDNNKVCKLRKAIYGLHQTGRQWFLE